MSATPSQGTYAAPDWTVGTLSETGPAATATLTIVATVTAPGALVNTATITQQTEVDPNAANNSASVTLNAAESANLTVTKSLTRSAPHRRGAADVQRHRGQPGPESGDGRRRHGGVVGRARVRVGGPVARLVRPGDGRLDGRIDRERPAARG